MFGAHPCPAPPPSPPGAVLPPSVDNRYQFNRSIAGARPRRQRAQPLRRASRHLPPEERGHHARCPPRLRRQAQVRLAAVRPRQAETRNEQFSFTYVSHRTYIHSSPTLLPFVPRPASPVAINAPPGDALLETRYAVEAAKAGYFFSVPPIICRSPGFQALVKAVPLESLLLETDSPALVRVG